MYFGGGEYLLARAVHVAPHNVHAFAAARRKVRNRGNSLRCICLILPAQFARDDRTVRFTVSHTTFIFTH